MTTWQTIDEVVDLAFVIDVDWVESAVEDSSFLVAGELLTRSEENPSAAVSEPSMGSGCGPSMVEAELLAWLGRLKSRHR